MLFVFLDGIGKDLALGGVGTVQDDVVNFIVFAAKWGDTEMHAGIVVAVIEDDLALQRFPLKARS